jgi:hypothetical protein
MVYYNILNATEKKEQCIPNTMFVSDTTTNSPLHPDNFPLQPLDKRALYTCLKKMAGEMNRKPELQLHCVEQASTLKDDMDSFQMWLEKDMCVLFTKEEVRGILDYIRLHSWGPIIIKDSTFISKMFEVPTPLNYSAWYANIDNMQIRSQFRNSLTLRPNKVSESSSSSPIKYLKSPDMSDRRIRIAEKTEKKEIVVIARDSSRLEQLQQKYLNRSSAGTTDSPPSSVTYTTTSSQGRKSRQGTKHLMSAGLIARPLPKLAIFSKQKPLSTPMYMNKKKGKKGYMSSCMDDEIFDDDENENYNYLSDDSSANSSVMASPHKVPRNRRGNNLSQHQSSYSSPSIRALPPSPIRRPQHQYITPSPDTDGNGNCNGNSNSHSKSPHKHTRIVSMSIQIPRVSGM